ncbi:TPA: hypothetical protein DCY43_01870 [candidate division WWE3 bacterium]|uniref:Phosphatidylethanolamine N-methyltransferase n=2 Tax=Katanobacteria TaxID=422282 RepID=A0A0G1MVH0_UNCKA|nr:MAG: Phosphatidylethanolamine N-methyltransferase [candidate division WWE3 bacterium GW2011_GWC2_44_9]HAZ29482.1 hypothetical protein [candidate division WWE3 bacterium]
MDRPDYNDATYDYTKYWNGRSYENNSETYALAKLLPSKGVRILDAGGGFGRLIPTYKDKFTDIVILDKSIKILSQAEDRAKELKVTVTTFVGDVYNLSEVGQEAFDCVVMVRIAHHLDDLAKALAEVYKVLKPGGVFIFEFANKLHIKSVVKHLIKMDNGYFSHEPISVASKNVMFFNFHPKYVSGLLEQAGFKVTKKLSVSNFRSPFLKRYIPEGLLNMTENLAQEPLARFNFGPSLFYRCVKASA